MLTNDIVEYLKQVLLWYAPWQYTVTSCARYISAQQYSVQRLRGFTRTLILLAISSVTDALHLMHCTLHATSYTKVIGGHTCLWVLAYRTRPCASMATFGNHPWMQSTEVANRAWHRCRG